ncbi:hypothetical protein Tco_1073067 [Tanacetum coccineum]
MENANPPPANNRHVLPAALCVPFELPEGNNWVPSLDPTAIPAWIHHHMGGSYYPIPCSILSTGKDCKTPQRYLDVPTTSWRISIRSMDSFQGLTPKNPSSCHRSLAPSPNFL